MQTSVDEGLCLLIIISPHIRSRICSDVKVGHDDDDHGVRGRLQRVILLAQLIPVPPGGADNFHQSRRPILHSVFQIQASLSGIEIERSVHNLQMLPYETLLELCFS